MENIVLLDKLKNKYPEKFAEFEEIFKNINRGDRMFISSACGEPQTLLKELINYVESSPNAFFDAEVLHIWSLGVAPYANKKFKRNFRLNSFFISNMTRDAVNSGSADYAPTFHYQVPDLIRRGHVPVNVALIHTSMPDCHGYVSLGVSVDIAKAAVETATLVIAQINPNMPRVYGDSMLHVTHLDYMVYGDDPLIEFEKRVQDDVSSQIGKYVASIVEDGDTIQVGYGTIPNAILKYLEDKKHLGIHTELFVDGLAKLIKCDAVDNSRKTINRNQTVASFCMGKTETYQYIDNHPKFAFMPVDYTNNPLVIAQNHQMTAINTALQIDLSGQATAESIGTKFFGGIGGTADFMRGAALAPNGKSILTMQSTAQNGTVSRIVPLLDHGAGVTLSRGDIHYVVTEYGIAYLYGKNIRERAMALISIAHPKFREELLAEAKKHSFIYKDQAFVPGFAGEYPEHLETERATKKGETLMLRPVKLKDEPLLKKFFYSLSDHSIYNRFISARKYIPHERLQAFVVINYTREMVILATKVDKGKEEVVGIGQYAIDEKMHTADVAFVVKDEYQGQGVGTKLLRYLTYLAKSQGILGFTADVLVNNKAMLHMLYNMDFDIEQDVSEGVYTLKLWFREGQRGA